MTVGTALGTGLQRIGLVGGTFDPPHVGHLSLAACAQAQMGLDRVLLVVANDPWQKSEERLITPSRHRLAMMELAVADHVELTVSAIEIDRGGPSYSIDTVSELRGEYPHGEFVLVLGTDVAAHLDSWHRHEELRSQVTVALAERPGALAARPPQGWQWTKLDMPRVRLSSSELRARLERRSCVDFLVPGSVIDYASDHKLYR